MLNLSSANLLRQSSFVNGEWLNIDTNNAVAVLNPANDNVITYVHDANTEIAKTAIKAASQAMPAWAALTAKTRASILKKWFQLIMQHQEDLALIMTAEQGRPLVEARAEIAYGASFIEWFAEEAKRVYGDIIPSNRTDTRLMAMKQPIGVVTAITPWNFPCAMITRKAAPALAAGCSIVIKPALETPLSALALAELAHQAGVPAGIINIVVSSDAVGIGKELSQNPLVKKLSFTGSTNVGKILMSQCANTVKKTSMELGGNAPFIIFDDADLQSAIKGLMASKFRNSGQTCVCSNRILVQEGIYDEFIQILSKTVKALRVGEGTDEHANIGPLIDGKALHNVAALVEEALAMGAKATVGGQPSVLGYNFYEPTVLTHVDTTMRVFKEEIFGPVAPVMSFKTEADAIEIANNTTAGLAAYVYTENMSRTWRMAEKLEYGMIGINEGIISTELAPFGGIKESGIGREGSKYGIEDFLELKYLCIGGMKT